MRRGEVWWASLGAPHGSQPGFRRPVVVVQSNDFNESSIRTIVCATITSNVRLALAPGNVVLRPREGGVRTESVVNVSQLLTIDKDVLTERLGRLTAKKLHQLDEGLRLVLAL